MNYAKKLPALLLTFCFASACWAADSAADKKVYKARWIMAHNPTNDPLVDLLKAYTKRVKDQTKGRLEIELTFLDNKFKSRHPAGLSMVSSGEAEFSQVAVDTLATYSRKFGIFNVPFLFSSHDEVKKALDGAPGARLKEELFANSGHTLRSMEFTYSGGFRVMWGSKPLRKIEDFKNARFAFLAPNSYPRHTLEAAGAKFPVPYASREETIMMHTNSNIDFEENELNRLYVLQTQIPKALSRIKFVTETNMDFYVTSIIAREEFLMSLPQDLRTILIQETRRLAEEERVFSIKQADESKEKLAKLGVTFVPLAAKLAADLKKLAISAAVENCCSLELAEFVKVIRNDSAKIVAGAD